MTVKKIAFATTALILISTLIMQVSSAVCINQQAGDTHRFGGALVANEKYLVVGDTQANRVVVYRHTLFNKWDRFRVISLPPNPPITAPNTNFNYNTTYDLAIAKDTLIIGKVISTYKPKDAEKRFYPYQPPGGADGDRDSGMAYTGAVYRVQLISDAPLERLDRPHAQELAGLSVTASGDKVAFSVSAYDGQNTLSGYTTVLFDDYRRTLPISGRIVMNNNLLVIGNTIGDHQGEISIFDLASAQQLPKTTKISIPVAGISLADKSVIVAEQLFINQFPQANPHLSSTPKTLIVDIPTLSIVAINEFGKVSANGNKLVISYPSTNDGTTPGKIKIFDLSLTPVKLRSTRTIDARGSFVTKDHLFTAVGRGPSAMICIHPSS